MPNYCARGLFFTAWVNSCTYMAGFKLDPALIVGQFLAALIFLVAQGVVHLFRVYTRRREGENVTPSPY